MKESNKTKDYSKKMNLNLNTVLKKEKKCLRNTSKKKKMFIIPSN